MKNLVLVLAAVAAYFAFTRLGHNTGAPGAKLAPPVDDLAHKLQDAWADHHTIA